MVININAFFLYQVNVLPWLGNYFWDYFTNLVIDINERNQSNNYELLKINARVQDIFLGGGGGVPH